MARLLVLDNVTPPLVLIVARLANIVAQMATPDIVITHGFDGEHKVGSLHKLYAAVDVRTHNLTNVDKDKLFATLTAKFPRPDFDVLFEDRDGGNEHIHIEDNRAMAADKTGAVRT